MGAALSWRISSAIRVLNACIGHDAFRRCDSHECGMEFQTEAARAFNIAADNVAALRPFLQHLVDRRRFAAGKIAQLGLGRIEGIGFMRDAADCNQRLACLCTKKQGSNTSKTRSEHE